MRIFMPPSAAAVRFLPQRRFLGASGLPPFAHAVVVHAARALARLAVLVAVLAGGDAFEIDRSGVAEAGEPTRRVPDIGDAARHAGGEIAPGIAEHDDDPAGHVFAAMVAG